jgi:hypothetical protein
MYSVRPTHHLLRLPITYLPSHSAESTALALLLLSSVVAAIAATPAAAVRMLDI